MVGERLRRVRLDQALSLQQVSAKASLSTATLSRIETGKQAVDVETLIELSRILNIHPSDLFDERDASQGEPLAQQFAALDTKRRTQVWNDMAANSRTKAAGPSSKARQMAGEVEELLAQIDFLRAEIESVKRRLR